MDSESRQLLEDTLKVAEENNKILRGIRRSQRLASFMRIIYWLVIVGIAVGSFYFLEPYINKMVDLYNSISGTAQKLDNTGSSFQNVLNKF